MRRLQERLLFAALHVASLSALPAPPSAANPEARAFRPGVSLIIPERATPWQLTETLQNAVAACRELDEPWEIIVVVNGFPASSYQSIAQRHRQVQWLFSERPLWYCGAVRRGIRASRYDWVYLLNSDMLLDRGALAAVIEWRSPAVFAIASQVFFRDPQKRREETGWTGFRTTGGSIEIFDALPPDAATVRGTFYAGGGASLFRRYLLSELIRNSSVYSPFYWEDVEWGARAWRLGYESIYCPASKAWHLHRMTNRLFYSEDEIDRIMARNRLIFHFRNGPPIQSFDQFLRLLDPLDEKSLDEILAFRRMAQIAAGRLQDGRLPVDHIPLDRTWGLRRGMDGSGHAAKA